MNPLARAYCNNSTPTGSESRDRLHSSFAHLIALSVADLKAWLHLPPRRNVYPLNLPSASFLDHSFMPKAGQNPKKKTPFRIIWVLHGGGRRLGRGQAAKRQTDVE
jgi:hypothetical protein